MKKLFFLFLLLLFIQQGYCQATAECVKIPLAAKEDYHTAESCVITAADFVLAQPLNFASPEYFKYRRFILTWMDETPDYSFSLNSNMIHFANEKKNEQLLAVYITCMSKAVLQNKKDYKKETVKLFAAYVANPANNVKKTAAIKKLLKAVRANKFDSYL